MSSISVLLLTSSTSDGLVHISQYRKKISHPSEILSVGDIVKVKILSVDKERGRIGLTMKL